MFTANVNNPDILPGGRWEQWCPGSVDAGAHRFDQRIIFERGMIYLQIRSRTVYKCPADRKSYLGR